MSRKKPTLLDLNKETAKGISTEEQINTLTKSEKPSEVVIKFQNILRKTQGRIFYPDDSENLEIRTNDLIVEDLLDEAYVLKTEHETIVEYNNNLAENFDLKLAVKNGVISNLREENEKLKNVNKELHDQIRRYECHPNSKAMKKHLVEFGKDVVAIHRRKFGKAVDITWDEFNENTREKIEEFGSKYGIKWSEMNGQ